MQRKFFSSLFILILLNILIKPVSLFLIDAGFQNELGHKEYGLYFSLLNFSLLFNILLDFGINNFTTRRVAQNPEKAKRLFGTLFTFRFVLFIFYQLFIFITAFLVGFRGQALELLFLLGINQFIIIAIAYFRSHFAGFHYFKLDAMLSVLDRFLLVVLGVYILFFYANNHIISVYDFVFIQLITYLISFCIAFMLFIKYIDKPKFQWNFKLSLEIIKRSIPYAILIVSMLFYTRIDSVLLERLHINGAEETGIYAQGYRLLDAFYMFGMLFAGLLFPMFSRALKVNELSIYPLLKSSGNLLVGGALLLLFISVYNGEFLLGLVYEDYQQAIYPFMWLMASFVAICMNFIFGTLLTASGDLKVLIIISLFGIILNVFLNSFFIPIYGANATAIIAFITQSFTAVAQCLYAVKKFNIPMSFSGLMKYPLFIGSLFVFSELLKNTVHFFELQLVFGFILLFVLSFISIRNIKEIINSKSEIIT